jgi:hypothetical protein
LLTDSGDEDEDGELGDEDDEDAISGSSMHDTLHGLQSRNSSLQSANASHFRSSGVFPATLFSNHMVPDTSTHMMCIQ